MIEFGKKYHLGDRALFFMLLTNVSPAVILLVVAYIILIAFNTLSQSIMQSSDILGQFSFFSTSNLNAVLPTVIMVILFIAIILVCVGAIVALLQYRFFTVTLGEFDIRLRKGIFNIQEITIPYRQMQNVDIVRSLFYRIFGVSKLVIMSAGHDEDPTDTAVTNSVFNPISRDIAEEIRVLLERKIGVQVVENR